MSENQKKRRATGAFVVPQRWYSDIYKGGSMLSLQSLERKSVPGSDSKTYNLKGLRWNTGCTPDSVLQIFLTKHTYVGIL